MDTLTTSNTPDPALLAAARAGDRAALSTLLEQVTPRILRFTSRMCGDGEDARDVAQETLLAAARSLPDFRGASSLSTWLFTIARSFCIKRRRKSRFAPERVVSGAAADEEVARRVSDPGASPEEELARRQVGRALDGAIAALEPKYREVLLLRDVEGLSAPEVASLLGLTVEAVKSRLHRARLSVRERVAPVLGDLPTGRAAAACPDVLTLLSRHEEDDITPAQCAEMERHLAGCPRCAGACASLRRTLALCRNLPTPEVPKETRQLVRRALDDLLR